MKTILVLPCKDQEDIIRCHLNVLRRMDVKPDHVVIIDDHSTRQTLRSSEDGWLKVVFGDERGRSTTRNRGVQEALSMGADVVVFMDGDSISEDELFFERLQTYFPDPSKPTLVFGTRVHTERPYSFEDWLEGESLFYRQYANKPSDLLTANMDNLSKGLPLDYSDLRDVAKVVQSFEEADDFQERVDLMLSGMVSWSCNFAVTRSAVEAIQKFMKDVYGLTGMLFDEVAFRDQWGYEDVAFGLDALYAGVDVKLQNQSRVIHFMHGRSDQLHTHVKGKHLIMQRYRHICHTLDADLVTNPKGGVPTDIVINGRTIVIKGRSFERANNLDGPLTLTGENTVRVGSYVYNIKDGTFKKSIRSFLLTKILKLLPL